MNQNNIFIYFLKFIFDINTSKQFKNIKNIIKKYFLNKKNKHFLE
jgi:hypothetical protein